MCIYLYKANIQREREREREEQRLEKLSWVPFAIYSAVSYKLYFSFKASIIYDTIY
jgi:hypothetical protein